MKTRYPVTMLSRSRHIRWTDSPLAATRSLIIQSIVTRLFAPLTLSNMRLEYEPLPSEAKQIRRWRRIAKQVSRSKKV